ncbi:MAG: SPL family radical SAM protein [Planctomycetota bacterium]|jgi:DNA repair photolyase
MVQVLHSERKSAVLTASRLRCLARVPTVNLTAGCAHGCVYCYARGYSNYPGDGKVRLYANTVDKLRDELRRKRKKPEAVYFSPSSDLFQPVPEVLDMAYEVLQCLFASGIGVAFLTKGRIPDRHLRLLERNVPQVRAQIGLMSLDEDIIRVYEPYAASPRVRLAQARELARAGITTQVRLDPLLPGLTDDADHLNELFAALAWVGVKRIGASVLFLRPAIVGWLRRRVRPSAMLGPLEAAFASATRLEIHAGGSSVVALPADARRAIHDRLIRLAGAHGIEARLCACKNPDVTSSSCRIDGHWPGAAGRARQLDLFSEWPKTPVENRPAMR